MWKSSVTMNKWMCIIVLGTGNLLYAQNVYTGTCVDPTLSVSSPITQCGQCTWIRVNYPILRASTSYQVISIPFAPPVPPSFGAIDPVVSFIDDVWGQQHTLPFTFCFLGIARGQTQICSNGALRFNPNLVPPNSGCAWSFSAPIPSPIDPPFQNAIHGAFHDIHPGVGGVIRYGTTGASPCRAFVVSFDNVPHYWCTWISTTQQMVLYEGTNVVDVYIYNKPVCSSWNSGNAVIGIEQNGATGWVPPGRNTGPWSASQEAWRFIPSGPPLPVLVEWFQDGNLIASGVDSIYVCPSGSVQYWARVTYTQCGGTTISFHSDTVSFNLPVPLGQGILPLDTHVCAYDTISVVGVSPAGVWDSIGWTSSSGSASIFCSTPPVCEMVQISSPLLDTIYMVAYDIQGCVIRDTLIVFPHNPEDSLALQDTAICLGDTLAITATFGYGSSYQWTPPGATTCSTCPTTGLIAISDTTTFILTVIDSFGCTGSDTLHLIGVPLPEPTLGSDRLICQGDTLWLSAGMPSGPFVYSWWATAGSFSCTTCPQTEWTTSTPAMIIVTVTDTTAGCTGKDTIWVQVEIPPSGQAIPGHLYLCEGDLDTVLLAGGAGYIWLDLPGVFPVNDSIFVVQPPYSDTFTIVALSDSVCPHDTFYLGVTVYPLPEISISGDSIMIEGSSQVLVLQTSGTFWWWSSGDTMLWVLSIDSPVIPYPDSAWMDTVIWACALSPDGCVSCDTFRVIILRAPECTIENLFVPTAFTPNQDGVNDVFYVYGYFPGAQVLYFGIWDRWGNQIFEARNVPFDVVRGHSLIGWDGTLPQGGEARPDVYVYYIEIACPDSPEPIRLKGDVTLLR